MFPELIPTVQYLWTNRQLWNELYLGDIEADTFKTPAEKEADKACNLPTACHFVRKPIVVSCIATTGEKLCSSSPPLSLSEHACCD